MEPHIAAEVSCEKAGLDRGTLLNYRDPIVPKCHGGLISGVNLFSETIEAGIVD